MTVTTSFDLACKRCPRLSTFLEDVKNDYPDYHCHPVPAFGVPEPDLLIVGLAPGMHGANATGRPFTGDYAGILLYKTLFNKGFSNQSDSTSVSDGLKLKHCRITNAVKCLPPQNKPTTDEIKTCNEYLAYEIQALKQGAVILALGTIAHNAIIRALGFKLSSYSFGHGNEYFVCDKWWLIDSYHCSRYNTQTKRLTEEMFEAVFDQARQRLS